MTAADPIIKARLQPICKRLIVAFFKMIFSRFAREPTADIVRLSLYAIALELAPESARARSFSSSECVHGRETVRAASAISLPSNRARRGGGFEIEKGWAL